MLLMLGYIFILLFTFRVYATDKAVQEQIFKVPNNYPKFLQCDSKWGQDMLMTKTICKVGCLITSVSMALNYYHIPIDGSPANPGTLNQWLKANNGYLQTNDFVEGRLEKLSPVIKYQGERFSMSNSEIIENLNNGVVRNGTHFVLITGYTVEPSKEWLVNDPYFNQTIYTNAEIVDYRIFTMK